MALIVHQALGTYEANATQGTAKLFAGKLAAGQPIACGFRDTQTSGGECVNQLGEFSLLFVQDVLSQSLRLEPRGDVGHFFVHLAPHASAKF